MPQLYKVLCRCLLCSILLTVLWVGESLSVSAQSVALDVTRLATLQGAGSASPFDGQEVATWGLVTGLTGDGFYLQDPVGDGDALTSDGIFVYTYDAPTVSVGQ